VLPELGEKLVEYHKNETKVRYIRKRKSRAAPIFGLWLFLLFCCLLAAYFFLNSTYFSVKSIAVKGNTLLSADEVISISGLSLGTNIFKLNVQEAVVKIETHPYIRNVKVLRKLPQMLILDVYERHPCAYVLGQDSFIAVDNEAIYLYKTLDIKDKLFPIISGVIVADNLRPGGDIKTPGLSSALELIGLLDEVFLNNVAEIIAQTPESLVLKTIQGVEVRFGKPEELERKVNIIQELLIGNGSVINDQTVEYIDLRYNTAPVIKRKN
jgi:cell division protein FtsQ